jgi:small subunit ribosomal protein S2
MTTVNMKQLLEAGVHFGHHSRRWNPKMAQYIYTERNGIYIVDLKKTLKLLREAYKFVRDSIALGKGILFVGTKKQAKPIIEESAKQCNMFYVNNRWLGGMLTNFRTIRRSSLRLIELENMEKEGKLANYSKKEVSRFMREKASLEKNLAGVKNMAQLPGVVFIIDTHKENIAVHEANKMRIPIVAIVDTNCDPDPIDYPIPGNDDAIRSIKLVCDQVVQAVTEGLMARVEAGIPAEAAAATPVPVAVSVEDTEDIRKKYEALEAHFEEEEAAEEVPGADEGKKIDESYPEDQITAESSSVEQMPNPAAPE